MTADRQTATVSFIGAGPGAPDLITVRGKARIERADVVIYADSLVHPGIAAFAKPQALIQGSASLTLEETVELMIRSVRSGRHVARVQSGDPSVYGAMHEQLARLESAGVPYEIIPGVSAAFAAAAALRVELTVPDVTQSIIFTRLAGRVPMPEKEALHDLAAYRASLVVFLSIPMIDRVVEELLLGGYTPDTPAAVVYRVTWEDEQIIRGTLSDIAAKSKAAKLQLQALILVGPALDETLRSRGIDHRSNLYNPAYTQRHRRATVETPTGTTP